MTAPVLSASFVNGNGGCTIGQNTVTAQPFPVGTQVFLVPIGPNETGSVPTPYQVNTPYWVIVANNNQGLQLSASKGGADIIATQTGMCGIVSARQIGYDTSGNAVFTKSKPRPPTDTPLPFQSYQAQSASIGSNGTGGSTGPSQFAVSSPGNAPSTIPKPHNPF